MIFTNDDRVIKAHFMHMMELHLQKECLATIKQNGRTIHHLKTELMSILKYNTIPNEPEEELIDKCTQQLDERIAFVKNNLVERIHEAWEREKNRNG